MIDIRDLIVERAGKTICKVQELSVASGENAAVIGANGSGKTTLLRVLGGLEDRYAGRCQASVPQRDRVYVHQSPFLFRGTVLFNACYGLAARNIPRDERTTVAQRWLATFGVGHLAERQCRFLSGGERRRVALARAFATQAALLLLDEPFADLDDEGIEVVARAIHETPKSTILISSPVPLPDGVTCRTYNLQIP